MPRILYKYLDIVGAKCMIGNQNLQFTNASQLNDPFDCHPKLIGLDIDKVLESVPPMFGTIYLEPLVLDVQYQDIIERPNAYHTTKDLFSYQWQTKAKEWEYEQEVRLVIPKPSPIYAAFTPQQAKADKGNMGLA